MVYVSPCLRVHWKCTLRCAYLSTLWYGWGHLPSFTVGTVMQNRSVPPTEIGNMLQSIYMAGLSNMFGCILDEVFGGILRIIGAGSM